MKITVASYNILHCENDGLRAEGIHRIDPATTAQTVKEIAPDLCGLNEVYNQCGGEGLCNQAEEMGKLLGMHAVFAEAIDIPHGKYGNALLSRYLIRSFRRVPIVTAKEERTHGGGLRTVCCWLPK